MQISNLEHHPPPVASDHSVMIFDLNFHTEQSTASTKCYYNKANLSEIRQHRIENDWSYEFITEYEILSAKAYWLAFKNKIHNIRDKFVLKRSTGVPHWKSKGNIPIKTEKTR